MESDSVTQAMLVFWGAVLLGLLAGGLIGWWRGFMWGVACGCLCIGAGGLAAAGMIGRHQVSLLQHAASAEGVVLELRAGTTTSADSNGRARTSTTYDPVVQFTASDGKSYTIVGLGASDSRYQPGDRVTVRYPSAAPGKGLIGDFQNQWGGVMAFLIFGTLPMLFGLFFVFQAREESDAANVAARRRSGARSERIPPRPPGRLQAWRIENGIAAARPFTIAGNLTIAGAFVPMITMSDMMRGTGLGFLLIALACVLHAIGFSLRPERTWQQVFISIIVAAGFLLFGAMAWLLA